MRSQWIKNRYEFETISQKWDQLLFQTDPTNPFLSSHFILTWWKYYQERFRIKILVLYEGQDLVGGLPLYEDFVSSPLRPVRYLYYLGGSVANYTEPLVRDNNPRYIEELLRWLNQEKGWDILHFKNVRAQHVLVGFSRKYPSSFMIQDHMNWAIDLSEGVEFYFKRHSKKFLKDLRSKRRRVIQEHGPLCLLPISSENELKKYLELYRNYSIQLFHLKQEKSNFEDEYYFNFFLNFLILMEKHQKLRAYVLKAGSKVLAMNFNLQLDNGFHWLLTSFNPEMHYFRPGCLLAEETIRLLAHEKQTYYNWYGHASFFKTQWCNKVEPLYRIKVVRGSLLNYGYHYAEEWVRSNPMLKKLVKHFY